MNVRFWPIADIDTARNSPGYYRGWRVLERNNSDVLKEIDAEEQEVLEEENPKI